MNNSQSLSGNDENKTAFDAFASLQFLMRSMTLLLMTA